MGTRNIDDEHQSSDEDHSTMLNDDFSKYEQMRDAGHTPHDIFLAAREDQLDSITRIRMLRRVFDLSLVQAKEITVQANNLASSLSEYQERFIPALEELFKQIEEEDNQQD